MTQPTKPLTAEQTLKRHVNVTSLSPGGEKDWVDDNLEDVIYSMEEYASQYKEEVDRLKEEIKLLKE